MSLSDQEKAVTATIASRSDELVELASDLIRFDTTARDIGQVPRDEERLQSYLADRLSHVGAKAELWEPEPGTLSHYRLVPPGLDFAGRPQMLARVPGSGGGKSLLLNGHIDVVSGEPRDRWTSDPNRAHVRDGLLYGRGACDMKGGIAAMVFAAETLAKLGVELGGDLLVCTVTDEESTGAGGAAAVAHGVRADAAIVPEPSNFDIWIACRGSLIPTFTVIGRPGHAGFPQGHWMEGGAVNAIDKMRVVMNAMDALQSDWHTNPDHRHPLLSPGDIVPVIVEGGEWIVSYPASCRLTYHVAYLPQHADSDGWGKRVEREITDWVHRAAQTDPWLASNPPIIEWAPDVPSAEVSPSEPIVPLLLEAASDMGCSGRITGMDNWHDGATFTRLGGTPAVCFGPGHWSVAHTIDEHVPIADLVACSQAIAVAAMRFTADRA